MFSFRSVILNMLSQKNSKQQFPKHDFLIFIFLLSQLNFILTDGTCEQKCHQNAICTNFENNEQCCKCNTGFVGNGINCFEKDDSIIVRGRLNGHINGIDLDDQEMHAYVHTLSSDARNYVALGRVPPEIGSKISLTLPITTPIHWLFAGDVNLNALNGFSLTGGVLTRQSDSTYFNSQGDVIGSLFVKQNFTGLHENSKELKVDTFIEGNLPELKPEEQVIYLDYNQNYQFMSQVENPDSHKQVETRGSIGYRVTTVQNPNNQKTYRIEHSEKINFKVCKELFRDMLLSGSADAIVSTRRLTVSYTESEGQVRFSSANYLKSAKDQISSACDNNDCSLFAECVNDAESENGYYCQCKPGFDGDGKQCNDINECEEGSTYCSSAAQCINLLGYYECKCNPPKVGDGRVCEWADDKNIEICSRCDTNARCITNDDGSNSYCKCNSGFVGDGFDCEIDFNNQNVDRPQPEQPQTSFPTLTTTTISSTTSRKKLLHEERCVECNIYARCEQQHEIGSECCACLEGYLGNGKYCLKESTPMLITGKVTGILNNQRLVDLDFYSYVLTHSSDSRNFVAIGKIPANLGGSFQVLLSIVNPINWLFAGKNGLDENLKVKNGFQVTGGQFSRVSTLTFFDEISRQSNSLTIRQEFLGLDAEGKEISVNTEITGTVPNIDPDAQVVFKDYKQEYFHESRGFIRSSGEINYEVTTTQNSQSFTSYKIYYNEDINYSECPHLVDQSASSIRVNSKRVYIKYTKGDNLVRFTSANYIYPRDAEDDPCEVNTCSIYAECMVDSDAPNNYTCVCKVGFEGDGFNCYDVDECDSGEADCDANAICYNLVGHFDCTCKSPFKGNGKECYFDLDCRNCDVNARCVEFDNVKRCICNDGYVGDGLACKPMTIGCSCGENSYCITNYQTEKQECRCKPGFNEDSNKCVPLPCNDYSNCNQNARCEKALNGNFECKCLPGFYGDGYVCTTQTCDVLNNCDENARCIPDSLTLHYRCVCSNGYIGNGYECVKDVQSCNVLKNCHSNAECLLEERNNRHFCKCKPGFTGDGFQCSAINSCRNRSPHEVCDTNADCVYDLKINDYICKCRSGFEGNGLRAKCFIDESFGLYLVYAQGSSLHKLSFKPSEEDNHSPHKNRIVYIPGQTAVAVSYDCHEQYIYWSDVSSNVINRIRPDGSNYSIVLQNVKSAESLAIDWISRNIYFTDSETRTIEVASLNGLFRKVLIKSHLNNPRGIAVDPVDGYIFWTDWNRKNPKIERANMDGTHRKIIVIDDLGVPNGLYFDQKRQEVCWGDAKTKRIECVEKDGSNRRIVTQMNHMYPFDLTEVRSNIYWSDWSRKEIPNVDKDGVLGQTLKLSVGGNGRVYGLVAVKNSCSKGTNACERNNGDCNQLCLPCPDHTRQCACSDESGSDCLKTLTFN